MPADLPHHPGRAPRSGMTRRLSTHRHAVTARVAAAAMQHGEPTGVACGRVLAGVAQHQPTRRFSASDGGPQCGGYGERPRSAYSTAVHSVQPVGIEHRDIGLGSPAGGDRPQMHGRA